MTPATPLVGVDEALEVEADIDQFDRAVRQLTARDGDSRHQLTPRDERPDPRVIGVGQKPLSVVPVLGEVVPDWGTAPGARSRHPPDGRRHVPWVAGLAGT